MFFVFYLLVTDITLYNAAQSYYIFRYIATFYSKISIFFHFSPKNKQLYVAISLLLYSEFYSLSLIIHLPQWSATCLLHANEITNYSPHKTYETEHIEEASETLASYSDNNEPIHDREWEEIVIPECCKKISMKKLVNSALCTTYRAFQSGQLIESTLRKPRDSLGIDQIINGNCNYYNCNCHYC